MDTTLEFLENPAHQDEGLGDAGIETFRETPYASAAKEAGQNSRDAMADRPVKLKIRLKEIDRADIPCAEQFSEAIDACLQRVAESPDEKEEDFFKRARRVFDEQIVKVLEISDYNTRGLVGPAERGKPFYALLKSSGVSNKQQGETSIGSFGIGKNASFAVSDIQTVFYSTIYKDTETGNQCFLAQGKTQLVSHVDAAGIARKATGWWGLPGYSEIDDPDLVPAWLQREETGTSVFSICFREEENWQYRVAAAILKTFFVSIHDGDMVFEINEEISINRSSLNDLFQNERIVEAAEASHSEDDFRFARNLYECLTSEEASNTIVSVNQSGSTRLGKVDIRILKKPGLPKRVGIVRNGMMITDNLKNFEHSFRTFPMCSEFVALVRPLEDSGSRLLKKLENPAHDSFSSQRISDETKQDEAFRSIKKLGKLIRQTIRSETLSKPEDVEALTELAEFFAEENKPDEEGDSDPTPTKFKYKLDRERRVQKRPIGDGDGDTGGGTGGGQGGGGGTGGGGTGGGKGSQGAKPVPLGNVRYIERTHERTLLFTPLSTGRARLRAFATGLAGPERLSLSASSEGLIEDDSILIDLTEEQRISMNISLAEDYHGPIELVAYAVEVIQNEN